MDDSRARLVRTASLVVGIVGLVLASVGVLGLVLAGGDRETVAIPATQPRDATAETTARAAVTTTTALPVRTRVEEFFVDWVNALRTGDAPFLIARLHPAVAQRYGDDACRAYLGSRQAPQASVEVLEVDGAISRWSWETDGRTTPIPDALGLVLRRTEDGASYSESPAHVALVNGEVRWFTDCGTPKES